MTLLLGSLSPKPLRPLAIGPRSILNRWDEMAKFDLLRELAALFFTAPFGS